MTTANKMAQRVYWWLQKDISRFLGVTVSGLVDVIHKESGLFPTEDIRAVLPIIDLLFDQGLLQSSGPEVAKVPLMQYMGNPLYEFDFCPANDWENRLKG